VRYRLGCTGSTRSHTARVRAALGADPRGSYTTTGGVLAYGLRAALLEYGDP